MSEHFNPEMGGAEHFQYFNENEISTINELVINASIKTKEQLHFDDNNKFCNSFIKRSYYQLGDNLDSLKFSFNENNRNEYTIQCENAFKLGVVCGVVFGENLGLKKGKIEKILASSLNSLKIIKNLQDHYDSFVYDITDYLAKQGPMFQVAERSLNLDAEPIKDFGDSNLQKLFDNAFIFSSGIAIEKFVSERMIDKSIYRNKLDGLIWISLESYFNGITLDYYINRDSNSGTHNIKRTKGPFQKMISKVLSKNVMIPQEWIEEFGTKE